MKPHELQEKLGLMRLRDRNWYVQPSVAASGDGLFEGLMWLTSNHKAWFSTGNLPPCLLLAPVAPPSSIFSLELPVVPFLPPPSRPPQAFQNNKNQCNQLFFRTKKKELVTFFRWRDPQLVHFRGASWKATCSSRVFFDGDNWRPRWYVINVPFFFQVLRVCAYHRWLRFNKGAICVYLRIRFQERDGFFFYPAPSCLPRLSLPVIPWCFFFPFKREKMEVFKSLV